MLVARRNIRNESLGVPRHGFAASRTYAIRVEPCRSDTARKVINVTKERLLAALDKPRTTYSVLMVVNPGGSIEEVQSMLMQMRDEGLVKFAIAKGHWSRA
jgi:hypothetical protein